MKGIVAAGDRLSARAGAEILKKGGNAFDCLAATLFAAYMAEPALTSPAGGGILLIYDRQRNIKSYDFFVNTPTNILEKRDFSPIIVDFGSAKQTFHIGHASIAVPGVLMGVLKVHNKYGVLSLKEVLQPAIKYAQEGVYISPFQSYVLEILKPIFLSNKEALKIFTNNGNLIGSNVLWGNSDYAKFLKKIIKEGHNLLYKGEIAEKFVDICIKNNGLIRMDDLSNYKVIIKSPLKIKFLDYEILTPPPSSIGGILISVALKMMENINIDKWGSMTHVESLIKVMEISRHFRENILKENKDNCSHFLEQKFINNLKTDYNKLFKSTGNTTHISVLDDDGNALSCTTSIGEGSGIIIPETGIMTNNMLGEEDLNPDGFFNWNPGERLYTMMSPTIIVKNDNIYAALGSSGSNRIRSAIIQTVVNLLYYKQDIYSAINNPRIHYESGILYIEPGFPLETISGLRNKYKVVEFKEKNLFFGGVQAVCQKFTGAGDIRRGGAVEYVNSI
jgi:gamma-glutamyltranspeptidase/glutathione hydrolase